MKRRAICQCQLGISSQRASTRQASVRRARVVLLPPSSHLGLSWIIFEPSWAMSEFSLSPPFSCLCAFPTLAQAFHFDPFSMWCSLPQAFFALRFLIVNSSISILTSPLSLCALDGCLSQLYNLNLYLYICLCTSVLLFSPSYWGITASCSAF